MIKERRCEEVVKGNGNSYRFSGTFSNVEKLSFRSGDPNKLYMKLSQGEINVTDIKNVLTCTLMQKNKTDVEDLNLEEEITIFIDDFGITDSCLVAKTVLSHALIGDVKKKQIERELMKLQAKNKVSRPFRFLKSKKLGWLWVGIFATLATSACTIISLR